MNKNNYLPPTKAQLKYIRANINDVHWHSMREQFHIDEPTLMQWCKIAFKNSRKESPLIDDVVEFEMKKLAPSGLMLDKKVISSPLRKYYLVTFDHRINFVVNLSRAVPHSNVMYAPSSVGCDYEVYPLGVWEYHELSAKVPTIHLEVTPNYSRSFWLQLKLALNEA